MSELHLVRHAQASFGSVNYDQLSELGHRQARFLGDHFKLRHMRFDQLVVGDMHRHHQTMDGICEGLGIDGTDRLVLPGLNEYNFIDMTETYGKIHGDNPLFQKVMEDPTDKKNYYRLLREILMAWTSDSIPGVPETWMEFKSRVEDAQNQIKAMSDAGNSILAIGSGGSISTFVGLVLGIPDENIFDLNLQYKNTAISHFFFNQKKMKLTGFNSVSHLDTNEMEQYITYG
ncbi:MAG: phosphoglycerate mutase [SAR92 bacterium BACL26 MAG-121220-bin70]|jgi:broad specificity phosphatase PhoE|uniref:Phosphoglycerate mutase n=1 Tax=SAR92 bacterium BACL26 MAG-121220-bin70 TaxID=1655626 RepID=A0A0R2UAR0_9GAMM|nr:MAG: phosphoglycerate mutase [SAR92 bacterium BACL26 MAG-121220-bin70]